MTVYFSEIRFENPEDFVEIVATDGEDLSGYSIAVYNSSGDLQYTHSLSGEFEVFYAGNDGYLVERADGLPDMGNNWGVALIDDLGNTLQFISGDGNIITANDGPAAGETSIGGPTTSGGQSIETTNGGSSYSAQSTPNPGTIPCFALGTLIDTPQGPQAVETLRPGDLVTTLDRGDMPVLWARQSTHWLDSPQSMAWPILISAGALGPDCPRTDLVVSPQHRVLVGAAGQLAPLFKDMDALVAAKALTGLPGIREMRGKKRITWVHFAFETHQVVSSNGCRTESLLLGPMVANRLTRWQLRELDDIFGAPGDTGWNGPCARRELRVGQAQEIIGRWRKARAPELRVVSSGELEKAAGHDLSGARKRDRMRVAG